MAGCAAAWLDFHESERNVELSLCFVYTWYYESHEKLKLEKSLGSLLLTFYEKSGLTLTGTSYKIKLDGSSYC